MFFFGWKKPRGRLDDWVIMIYPPKTKQKKKPKQFVEDSWWSSEAFKGRHPPKLDLYDSAIQFVTVFLTLEVTTAMLQEGPINHSEKVAYMMYMVVWWNLTGVISSSL